jgi:UDPglucose 6-dehydrogenase
MKVGIFGAGWVGLVTGTCLADLGHDVVIRDVVPEKVEALRTGRVPFHEEDVPELLERNRERLSFTLDAGEVSNGAEFLFVCVDTPPTYSGDADLSRVWTVVDELPRFDQRTVLVMKSTVPVGTGEKVRAGLDARGLDNVGYVSNPEFLAEGRAVHDFMNPDRIVIGAFEEADGDAVEALYEGVDSAVVRCDVNSAEMIKLAANAFLMTRISFINEIANVCELTGADVTKVAEGVGLDHRLGPHFLRAGIGYGGSCLAGDETVLVRRRGHVRVLSLETLFDELSSDAPEGAEVVWPDDVEVAAWEPETDSVRFLPVGAATRRRWDRPLVQVKTKLGRRVRCTPDHPFVVSDGAGGPYERKLAADLTGGDWLPLAQAPPSGSRSPADLDVLAAARVVGVKEREVIVRPADEALAGVGANYLRDALPAAPRWRPYDIFRTGAMRLDEAIAASIPLAEATVGTARNGTYVPVEITPDEAFWRVVGLYIAEGHCTVDGARHRLAWSFHPTDEVALVDEVASYWRSRGVKVSVTRRPTATCVTVSSRLLARWWLDVLGLGRDCYGQRVPDLIWSAPDSHKRALLAGMWLGDGSWSYVNRGPSVVLEYGTVSREVADGLLRLLGDLGVAARLKVGRTAKSTVDTYWIVVSGAGQVERLLEFLPADARPVVNASLRRQAKRIAPTGYRVTGDETSSIRVTEVLPSAPAQWVYSLEVPGAHTFVTTGGLIVSNCFPKDSLALKQLASNSGYHFQLLSAVIEVNELQKRRVIAKLQKHLGRLRGKRVALLGLAFKPHTDDMREAPSIVLASRLLAEGADVTGWDPVAKPNELLRGVEVRDTPLEAVRGADAAVIVTEWPELRDLPSAETLAAMSGNLIVDGRNLLDPESARAAGFVYEGVGRSSSPFAGLPESEEEPATA